GKKPIVAEEDSDSDSDSDDDIVVPVLRPSVEDTLEKGRAVRRKLIFGIPGITDNAVDGGEDETESSGENMEATSTEEGIHYGRFDQALHDMLNDPNTPALLGRDAPPVYNDRETSGVDSALSDFVYEGDEMFVGHVFKSKTACKIKLAIHAINRKFHFKTTRSSPDFMVVECVGHACPWRVYAAKLDESENFQIRQAQLSHTCTVDERRNYHKLATTQVIGEIL
ncbi:unnamed protein product, partial [Brassica rapa subsp. trilocularis]